MLFLLFAAPVCAQTSTAPAPSAALKSILNPDGTVRAGAKGSFNAQGYVLSTSPDGQPSFQPAAAAARGGLGAGDSGWSNEFAMNGANDVVYAVVTDGQGNVYIGGDFTAVGSVVAYGVAKWNGTAWSALSSVYNGVKEVRALALDSRGTLYAGGLFQYSGARTVNYVAKWNGSQWLNLANGLLGSVRALAVDAADNLYAGGSLGLVGLPVATGTIGVSKWNGSTWTALGTTNIIGGNLTSVAALAFDGAGNLYAGGDFTTMSGVAARNVAKWNGTTWTALGAGTSHPSYSSVYTLAIDGSGNVYAGGQFDRAGGAPANNIARWNGTAWTALGTGTGGSYFAGRVTALKLDGTGGLYVGGHFLTAGGSLATRLARWDGSAWQAQGLAMSGDSTGSIQIPDVVNALALDGRGHLLAGGCFIRAGNAIACDIAQLTLATTQWTALGAPAGGGQGFANRPFLYCMVADGNGNVYVGGDFGTVGHKAARGVAKWNGTSWTPLGTGINGRVQALALDRQGGLYAAGQIFDSVTGAYQGVARWNGTTWQNLGFGGSAGSYINALAVDAANNLYAGGTFSAAGSVAALNVAKWNGTAWSALGAGLPAAVFCLAVDANNNLYAGSAFLTVTSPPVYRWNGTTWTGLGTGVFGHVKALLVDANNNVYAGGTFTSLGGVNANYIAKWNGTTWNALGNSAFVGDANVTEVDAIAPDGAGGIYIGTYASNRYNTLSQPMAYVARWNGTSWTALGTGVEPNRFVRALAWTGTSLYAAGTFSAVGDSSKVMSRIGRYTPPPPTLTSLSPNRGPIGSTVALTGTNLAGTSRVSFAGSTSNIVATGFSVNAAGTQISGVVVPAGAQTGNVSVTTPGGVSNGVMFTLGPLSATTAAATPRLQLHPNPAHERATVAVPAAANAQHLTLTDALGREVRRYSVAPGAAQGTLNLRGLPAGCYFVRTGQAASKLLVE
ncbi:T9SS type A sorting domain-containing protein [Hymenobacter sp. BT523]|uniref:T9SS type A sorting domain-containing protein n=1 Tax=Hymenobacter sp. BT523 TaxID=2795725 RepID=UPI0018ED8D07|nr:T9SS type A sorting domain-containing protein [Hymenobacter sp. BT523]MBJ6110177.1 T9SS type A sorting domain-containing protein [Hymenobacter sp. BT523]